MTSVLTSAFQQHRDFLILTFLVLSFAIGLFQRSSPSSTSSTSLSRGRTDKLLETTTITTTTVLTCHVIPQTVSSSSSSPSLSTPTVQQAETYDYGNDHDRTATTTTTNMSWFQKTLTLPLRSRGSYLITDEIVSALPEIRSYRVGILHLFVQHTSCALSLNENWDSDVRADMSDALDRLAPEDRKGELYRHSAEGLDDMPAHIKSALVGASVTVPISNGRLATGTWQGIWYLEFRASKHTRKVVATIQGEKA